MVNIMAKPDALRTQHTDTHTPWLERQCGSRVLATGEAKGTGVWWGGVCTLSHVRLHDPMDWSPPGSSVHGIFQARILEWVAISYSRGSSRPRDGTHVSGIGRQMLYHQATWEGPPRHRGWGELLKTSEGRSLSGWPAQAEKVWQ